MKKLLFAFLFLLLSVSPSLAIEADVDEDNVFDSTFKFDVDNLYDSGAQISANALSLLKCSNYAAMRVLLYPGVTADGSDGIAVAGSVAVTGSVSTVTEAYDETGWDADLTVPTKDAVRDKIESLPAGGDITSVWDVTTGAGTRLYQAALAFSDGDATPDVSAGNIFITANTGATVISDFDTSLVNGQPIWIIVNDANTTFDLTSSGLEGVGGADYVATTGDLILALYTTVDSQWHLLFWPSTIGVASIGLPSSDADPSATAGQIRHDSTVTGLETGAIAWYDGDEIRYLVDLDVLPSSDDYVVAYDADADKFYMKVDATGAGGSGSVTTVKEADVQVGDADIVILDFGAGFDLAELPDTEIQISLDLTEYTGNYVVADSGTLTFDESTADPNDADVVLSATDGVMKFAAANGANNEDLTLNLDATANEVAVASFTAVDNLNFGAIRLETTGDITGGVLTASKAAAYTVGTDDPREAYGGTIYVTSAAVITAPAIADGMSFTVITIGAIAVSVDVNASDLMYLDGTALADGDKATNTSTTGDILVCQYYSADGWYCMSGSPDGDHWTDTN